MNRMFDTHSHSWQEAGLARKLSPRAVRRARLQLLLLLPALAAIVLAYVNRKEVFGLDLPVRILAAVALVSLGWQLARDVGRSFGPALFRRLDPGTAGTVGFLIRLATILISLLVALRFAGLSPRDLTIGGAFSAVILGLAAQQTIGNLFAGLVLLSARPFRVGDRVRLQGGGLAGTVEGVVSSLGLLYTTLSEGEDETMVPNNVVLGVAVVPLREPAGVDLRARLRPGVTPLEVEALLREHVSTPVRDRPRIALEELDGEAVVVRITATPEQAADGPQLASEVLGAMAEHTTASDTPALAA
jgi:small conductance mechanosensitive channel